MWVLKLFVVSILKPVWRLNVKRIFQPKEQSSEDTATSPVASPSARRAMSTKESLWTASWADSTGSSSPSPFFFFPFLAEVPLVFFAIFFAAPAPAGPFFGFPASASGFSSPSSCSSSLSSSIPAKGSSPEPSAFLFFSFLSYLIFFFLLFVAVMLLLLLLLPTLLFLFLVALSHVWFLWGIRWAVEVHTSEKIHLLVLVLVLQGENLNHKEEEGRRRIDPTESQKC